MIQLNNDTIKVKENGHWSSLSSLTGPQGERGLQGPQGIQGPQGPAGQDGYPTISSGDAGKVLTVNSSETAPEWGSIIQGINVVKNIDASSSPIMWTQEEMDALKLGDAVIDTWQNILYVCYYISSYDIKFFSGGINTDYNNFGANQSGLILYRSSGSMYRTSFGGDVIYRDVTSFLQNENVGTSCVAIPSAGGVKGQGYVSTVKEYILVKKPSVAGTYTLQCTYDGNGNYTYDWV